ncbi:hypothetical protein KP509_04G104800 [Ceratopteris richardii]|nr:hypothetical protein KP509_04G104800 [Ceratopteris richardii]
MASLQERYTTTSLNEYLVSTLCMCNDLDSALNLFHSLSIKTVFVWTAVISAYVGRGDGVVAFTVYARMLEESALPNEYTYTSMLKACGIIPSVQSGKALHACLWCEDIKSSVAIASPIIRMYSKCNAISNSEMVFQEIPQHDILSWTSMISSLIEHELIDKALALYRQMEKQGISPNEWTVSICLQGCCILAELKGALASGESPLEIGKFLHHDAALRGFEMQTFVGSALLRMYDKCMCILEAEATFCSLPDHDVVTWTAMLSSFVEQGKAERALQTYRQMLESFIDVDKLAILSALQACCALPIWDEASSGCEHSSSKPSLDIGWALYADARKKHIASDVFIGNTLMHLFAKCRRFVEAESVFNGLSVHDVVSFSVIMSVYTDQGQAKKALQLYQKMQEEGVSPDDQTVVNGLKACCKCAEEESEENDDLITEMTFEVGRALHHDAVERGYDHNLVVGSELVTFYGKHGSVIEAEYSFNNLFEPDAMAYSALLLAFTKEGRNREASQLYSQLLAQGIIADDRVDICMLQCFSASRNIKDLCKMHHTILHSDRNSLSLELSTKLIFVYASYGNASDAHAVLSSLSTQDVVAWNALMSGSIHSGDYAEVFRALDMMRRVGREPNESTFVSLLSACSHAGLIERGIKYFESMSKHYGQTPRIEHYGCMIDLFGRIGSFNRIEELLLTMQGQPDVGIWLGLLGACQVHGNVELAKYAYKHAVSLRPRQAAAYVLMSNVFTNAGMKREADDVNLSRQKASAWKKPGQSWILVNGAIHTFIVKEDAISQLGDIVCKLQQKHMFWRLEGFVPQIDHHQPS